MLSDSPIASQAGGPRILIVDDEPSICRAIEMAAVRRGYSVRTAHSGEEGERAVAEETFAAVIMDLKMKDIRGDAVFHYAVAYQPHLQHRTVFVTGDVTLRGEQIIAALGCPLVRKPFELDELFGVLGSMTGWSDIERLRSVYR